MTRLTQTPVRALPLDQITALGIAPGARVTLHGQVTSSFDGSLFDSACLFDFKAGALRVVASDPGRTSYVVEAMDDPGLGCIAVGSPSPCLVPRLPTLAHQRLRSVAELASTLSGTIELEPPLHRSSGLSADAAIATGASMMSLLGFTAVVFGLWRRRRRSVMARVRRAAHRALRVTRGDPTFEPVARQIRVLLERAQKVDGYRYACARKLATTDRRDLERRVQSGVPAGGDAVPRVMGGPTTEREAINRLENEHASTLAELARIESALNLVALRSVVGVAPSPANPAAALLSELDLRDEAIAEAETP